MVTITTPTVNNAPILTEIAYFSKAYWGYDDEFMKECREELSIFPEDLNADLVRVAKNNDEIVGFYKLNGNAPTGELEMLFVHPNYIGLGIGRLLIESAKQHANKIGMKQLLIDSDPNAEQFYVHMGAVRVGETPSGPISGRMLPKLMLSIKQ